MNITTLNKMWMKLIKDSNKKITFISFVRENNQDYVRVIVKNDLGSKDKVTFKTLDGASSMRAQEWEYIQNKINSGDYANEGSL